LDSTAVVAAPPLRLYTFSLSHFSEKIRWTLGAAGITFQEVPWTPFFHILKARSRGRGTTVPVVEVGSESVQDSTRILLWLEEHRAPFALIPSDPAARDAALAIEKQFDEVGAHVVRYAYSEMLDDADAVVRFWTPDATSYQSRVIRRWFPVMRWAFRRQLRMSAANVARSRATIASGLAFLESQIGAGKRYLVGDRLSVADLTAAALLAPLACPDEHPIYGSNRYRAGLAPLVRDWESGTAFQWVRQMYREHRGPFERAAEIRQHVEG
jgi:glutathione S-transferase